MMMEDDDEKQSKQKENIYFLKVVGDGLGTLIGVPIAQKNKSDLGYEFFIKKSFVI